MQVAKESNDLAYTREHIVGGILRSGSITTYFERKDSEKVTYSRCAHTRIEVQTEFAKWVCQSVRLFSIVKDRGLLSLLKTGRPGYYIPSPSTVACNVKTVFSQSRNRIAKMVKVCVSSFQGMMTNAQSGVPPGIQRQAEFRNGHLDVAGPPRLCSGDCTS